MAQSKQNVEYRKLSLQMILAELARTEVIDQSTVENILEKSAGSKEYPLSTVAKFDLKSLNPPELPLTLESLVQWLAKTCQTPYFEIDSLKIDINSLIDILPGAYVRNLQAVPVKVTAEEIWVATSEPFDLYWVQDIETTTGLDVVVVVSNPIMIRRFIEEVYTLRSATQQFRTESSQGAVFGNTAELDKMLGKAKGGQVDANAPAIVRIVEWVLQFSCDERATDIHLEPRMGRGVVRFRIDGRMRVVYVFEPGMMLAVVSRLKVLANMAVDEHRKPQDGSFRYMLADSREMEMRTSTIPAAFGEKLVIRIFDPQMASNSFSDLGLAPKDIKIWEGLITQPHGLVLVTGPTGSGKSTTLHTSLRQIAGEDVNICTIEDPIEIVNDEINQMQVNAKIDVTFGNAIRAFLRQDPDVIMVGEIRDTDAGKMAIQAALTGHLVLSTLHTNTAISSIPRLIDLGIPAHMITACLRGMMAQRLVRRLCEHCKELLPTPKEAFLEMAAGFVADPPPTVFKPVGCRECKHSGFRGRLCVYEMVVMDGALRDCIRRQVSLDELMAAAKDRYTPLRLSGANKVMEGLTSIDEVMRVVN